MRGNTKFHTSPRSTRSPEDRFLAQVVKRDGCWGWLGTLNNKGYPVVNVKRENGKWIPMVATRLSYAIAFGQIPDGMEVCHKCDNPQCSNPDHLFLGTHRENFSDQSIKGRSPLTGAKLTFEQAEEMRARHTSQRGSIARLATEYGISSSQVSMIISGKRWKRQQGLAAVQAAMAKLPSP